MNSSEKIDASIEAIQNILSKIDRFNSTVHVMKEIDPDDRLSVDGHRRIQHMLVFDLIAWAKQLQQNVELEILRPGDLQDEVEDVPPEAVTA